MDRHDYYLRTSPVFALAGEQLYLEVIDDVQTVRRCRWPSDEVIESVTVPLTHAGCHIESFHVSPSGTWATTERLSGQGEWGYDIFQTSPLQRLGGVDELRGFIREAPRFAADESRIAVLASRWLNWVQDEDEVPSDGGLVNIGWLYVHRLPDLTETDHEVVVKLPAGWKAERKAEFWYLPRGVTPVGDGLRVGDWCGRVCDIPGPLPEVIVLPTPHPSGDGWL